MKNKIPDIEKRIIFEDYSLLVINKPFDIPSTGKNLSDDDCVQFWLQERQGEMIWAIHQLDADTTGVNIFVKKKELVKVYKECLADINSVKHYLAIVHGKPEWNEIDEKSPIGYIDERSLGVSENGKSAHSHFERISSNDKFSLIKARIYTGRTHQIRIHLSHLGHPLVGEEWYSNPPCKLHIRQALHARKTILNFVPQQTFTADLPPDFIELAKKLNLSLKDSNLQ
jgi:23S rRNA pseudouridine1911/1915/1917 synthase